MLYQYDKHSLKKLNGIGWPVISLICHYYDFSIMALENIVSSKIRIENTGKILAFTAWTFFVVLNAYYGGAMTMFFANEISFPMETAKDALSAIPDWTIVTLKGTEANFQTVAAQVCTFIIL